MFSKEKFNKMSGHNMNDFGNQNNSNYFDAMTEKCCNNMSENNEKKNESSKDKKHSNPMMDRMFEMMQNRRRSGGGMSMMKDMCSEMMSDSNSSNVDEEFGTTELKALFKDWLELIKAEIEQYIKDSGNKSADEIASHLNLSKESIEYILDKTK